MKSEDSISATSPTFRGRSKHRSRPPLQSQSPILGSPLPSPAMARTGGESGFYRSTSLETRSRSPSPNLAASPPPYNMLPRSRSPSPSPASPPMPKRVSRRLPAAPTPTHSGGGTPQPPSYNSSPAKPASLNLSEPKYRDHSAAKDLLPVKSALSPSGGRGGNINFPRLSASPTRVPKLNIPVSASSSSSSAANAAASAQLPSHHHAPLPGRLGRPEPYSPTERNNLNKMSDSPTPRSSTLPSNQRTRAGRDGGSRDSRSLPRASHPHSPDMHRRGRHDDLFMTPHQGDNLARGGGGHSRGGVLPNGFKPKPRKPEKYEMRSDSNAALKEDSDEDDDWC